VEIEAEVEVELDWEEISGLESVPPLDPPLVSSVEEEE
jgi:hypothetical protein